MTENPYGKSIQSGNTATETTTTTKTGGNTIMDGTGALAGLGGAVGAVLGSWLRPNLGYGGVGGVVDGVGVNNRADTILLSEKINNLQANNDSQTQIIEFMNVQKQMADILSATTAGAVTAEAAGDKAQLAAINAGSIAKDAAFAAGDKSTQAAQAAGLLAAGASRESGLLTLSAIREAQTVSERANDAAIEAGNKAVFAVGSVGDRISDSIAIQGQMSLLNSAMVAKDTVGTINTLAMSNTRDLLNGLSGLSVQALQNKYEASIQAERNRNDIVRVSETGTDRVLAAINAQNLESKNDQIAELNRKLTVSQTHVLLEEEFEEFEERCNKGRRREKEVEVNVNNTNNNVNTQNQINALASTVGNLVTAVNNIVGRLNNPTTVV